MAITVTSEQSTEITVTQASGTSVILTTVENVALTTESKASDLTITEKGIRGEKGAKGDKGEPGNNGTNGVNGLGFTGGSYDSSTGVVSFTSDDGLGFSTDDLRATGSQIDLSTSTSETAVTITPSGGGAATDIASASTSSAGVMTKTLFDKLDGVEEGATADQTASEIRALVESATDSNVFTDDDHTKLGGIDIGATVNDTDANLKARANHTGTQAASTIIDFDTEVSNNSSVAANTLKVTFPGFGTSSTTALRGDTTTISADQASAITANTSKVSADGLVTTHSDVTDAGSGQIITDSERSEITANTAKVSSKVNVTSSKPTSASDFTIGGVTYNLLFDESSTSSSAFLYGLNSGSTAIYRAKMDRSTILTLDVTSFVLQDSSGSTISSGLSNIYEIGATTNIFKENCQGFNANYNNVSGGTLSGTNTISVTNRSSSQGWGSSDLTVETSDLTAGTPQTLVDFRDGTAQSDFDVYYPNDATWDGSERKTLRFSLTANDGTTQDTASMTFYFKNRVFHGGSSNSSLTSGQIIALDNSPFTGSDFSLSETSVTTSGTQYYYYCYPSRLFGTPKFKIGPNPTDFTALTDVSVTNSSGYVETYKVFQSPEQYTNASFTLTVET
ncbi:MAG: hypothetical protein Unbinned4409contig1001_18 [Prokaryotic dsDNA virus sp.]|nr:MAG: hypothetical protein Unbinned4409contig1001_18 [Prokaryotic dsDNA virus sp.]|tara:strand:- start:12692 stop:14554 length:1863 start_codon:yes stop_codon:yes gene_type:complete